MVTVSSWKTENKNIHLNQNVQGIAAWMNRDFINNCRISAICSICFAKLFSISMMVMTTTTKKAIIISRCRAVASYTKCQIIVSIAIIGTALSVLSLKFSVSFEYFVFGQYRCSEWLCADGRCAKSICYGFAFEIGNNVGFSGRLWSRERVPTTIKLRAIISIHLSA